MTEQENFFIVLFTQNKQLKVCTLENWNKNPLPATHYTEKKIFGLPKDAFLENFKNKGLILYLKAHFAHGKGTLEVKDEIEVKKPEGKLKTPPEKFISLLQQLKVGAQAMGRNTKNTD